MPGEQLPLSIPSEAPRRLPTRIAPMQPTAIDAPFDDPDYLFEPWWPGVRCLCLVEGGALRLQVAGLSDASAALPELGALPAQVAADGVVLDGTVLVLDRQGRPDPDLLRSRLAGLPSAGRAAFVAADLLWSDGEPWTRRRFATRRAHLEAIFRESETAVVGSGYPREGRLVAEALAELGIAGLSARDLGARHRSGPAGTAWLRAPIVAAEPRERPTLALIQRLPLDVD